MLGKPSLKNKKEVVPTILFPFGGFPTHPNKLFMEELVLKKVSKRNNSLGKKVFEVSQILLFQFPKKDVPFISPHLGLVPPSPIQMELKVYDV